MRELSAQELAQAGRLIAEQMAKGLIADMEAVPTWLGLRAAVEAAMPLARGRVVEPRPANDHVVGVTDSVENGLRPDQLLPGAGKKGVHDLHTQLEHPEIPPCPSWCVFGPGHDYTLIDDDWVQIRYHYALVHLASPWANVVAEERRDPDGTITVGQPQVALWTSDSWRYDSDQAAAISHDLTGTLVALDRITTAGAHLD
jgi:hypothetical protein